MISAEPEKHDAVKLLLLLSRASFTAEEKAEAMRICGTDMDWRLFADLAIRHGVAALVWQNLTDLDLAAAVSEPQRKLLDAIRFRTIARVSYVTATAAEIVSALKDAGIRALILKGLALEHTVYGSRGLRQMNDADLLVSPDDLEKAKAVLTTIGFVSQPMKSPLYRHIMLDLGNHIPEMHRGGMSVDLHHRLFGPKGKTMVRDAISKPGVVISDSNTFYILPPTIAFLGLISHLFKHEIKGEFQLRLYTDLYLLLKRHTSEIIDDNLKSNAEEAGIAAETRIVMTILKQAYKLEIPPLFEAVSENEKSRADCFMNYLYYPDKLQSQSQRSFYNENIRSLPGLKKKLIFITGDLFPSIEFMKRRYCCRTLTGALLRYPHRLGKLIWIFGLFLTRIRGY